MADAQKAVQRQLSQIAIGGSGSFAIKHDGQHLRQRKPASLQQQREMSNTQEQTRSTQEAPTEPDRDRNRSDREWKFES